MSKVSYEILTEVHKTFVGKTLRAYIFNAQIIVDGVTYPIKGQIPTRDIKTNKELKNAIVARMDEIKLTYEKKFDLAQTSKIGKEPIILTETVVFKSKLSTIEELSVQK